MSSFCLIENIPEQGGIEVHDIQRNKEDVYEIIIKERNFLERIA